MPQRASTFAPFQHSNFRTLWTATLVSNLGGLIQGVGAGWMMTTISDSPIMVALVQGATTLPIMLFSLASGALADNFDRRRIMLSAQIMLMLVSIALAAFAFMGWITPWLLLSFTFLLGCGTALHNPPWQASMGDIVPRADLPRESFVSAMSAGLRYVSMSPNLSCLMLRACLFGVTAISSLALLPLVARELVAGGALTYGGLLGAFGVGAIIGGVINGRVRERLSNEWIVRLACIGFGLSNILLAFSSNVWLSLLLLMPAGACWVMALSLFNVTVQLSTPRWVVARALSLYQTATFGGMAVGSWIWGVAADAYGPAMALLGSGVVLIVTVAVGLSYRLPEFGALNLDPLDPFREPDLRLDLKARSGPIMIMIDYTIAQDDVPAFLAAMSARRRIRIRDGARQWGLLRDLENPETWTESYHVPTWVEYLRHNQRRTQADAEVSETLTKLHRGPERPRVHRMIERQTVPLGDDMPLKGDPQIL